MASQFDPEKLLYARLESIVNACQKEESNTKKVNELIDKYTESYNRWVKNEEAFQELNPLYETVLGLCKEVASGQAELKGKAKEEFSKISSTEKRIHELAEEITKYFIQDNKKEVLRISLEYQKLVNNYTQAFKIIATKIMDLSYDRRMQCHLVYGTGFLAGMRKEFLEDIKKDPLPKQKPRF